MMVKHSPDVKVTSSEVRKKYLLYVHLQPRPRFNVLQYHCVHGHIPTVNFLNSNQVLDVVLGMLNRYRMCHHQDHSEQHLRFGLQITPHTSTALFVPCKWSVSTLLQLTNVLQSCCMLAAYLIYMVSIRDVLCC